MHSKDHGGIISDQLQLTHWIGVATELQITVTYREFIP